MLLKTFTLTSELGLRPIRTLTTQTVAPDHGPGTCFCQNFWDFTQIFILRSAPPLYIQQPKSACATDPSSCLGDGFRTGKFEKLQPFPHKGHLCFRHPRLMLYRLINAIPVTDRVSSKCLHANCPNMSQHVPTTEKLVTACNNMHCIQLSCFFKDVLREI